MGYRLVKSDFEEDSISEILVAGDWNLPPYEYVDENGDYTGFNVDIMHALSLELGIKISIRPMEWEEAKLALSEGRVDALQGMRRTPERENQYAFTNQYFENSYSIFVQNGNSVETLESLRGKKVAVQKGDASAKMIESIDKINIVYVSNQKEAIELLDNSEVDASIGNTLSGIYFINQMGINEKIDIAITNLKPSKYGVAILKNNDKLLNKLNEGLDKINRNGTYDKIYRKWFGRPIDDQREVFVKTLKIFLGIFLASFFMFFIMFKWNDSLKKEVALRTDKLNEELKFKQMLMDSIPIGILYFKNGSKEHFINKKGKELIEMINPKDSSFEFIKSIFLKSDKETYHESEFVAVDGNIFLEWFHTPINLVSDENGGDILIFSDKTEKKYFEEMILSQDRLRTMGLMMAEVAHEIRNPLMSISNYAQIILEKINDKDFVKEFSKDVPQEIRRLDKIISDVLNYTKPSKSLSDKVSPKEVAMSVISLLNMRLQTKNISLEIISDEKDPSLYVDMDPKHLKQVFFNIYLNSIDAIDKFDGSIITKIYRCDEYVCIGVSDNGKGMSELELSHLYEPFYSRKKDGNGLGVFVCEKLLRLYGASILYESEEGIGTNCTIKLPRSGDR